ncbi:DUF305 domain-containing protein [Lentzea sp. NPDC059081]|uniref:DUF305 domain-containing protein n=1 Tax=Lentzea sp. NPDC059081 TaxID=3346719 RepID=UPI0036B396B1
MRALVLAVVLAVAGCSAQAAQETSGTAATPPDLSATDLAFVDLVIPQNESALAALALARPGSALRPVADRVAATYQAELVRLRDVLARAGRPESDQHEGHDMPGMITAAELASLEHSPDADEQLRTLLRTQFEEARTVARAELASGRHQPVRDLGASIDRTRAEFLALLGAA